MTDQTRANTATPKPVRKRMKEVTKTNQSQSDLPSPKTQSKRTTRSQGKGGGFSVVKAADYPEISEVKRPSFAVYSQFTKVEGVKLPPGTYWHGSKQSGREAGIPVDYRICDPLWVDAVTIDSDDGSHGFLARFKVRGSEIEVVIPMEALAGSGEEINRPLLRKGLAINVNQKKMMPEYISSFSNLKKILATTKRVGWHKSGAFVLPGQILGGQNIRYHESGISGEIYSTRGDLKSWREKIASLCQDNPVLILALCTALSGPFLEKIGIIGGGFHFMGDSSSGKTLALFVAASVWGNPDQFIASWYASQVGYEIEAYSRNNTVLLLDEIKRANPKYVQEVAYALSNGMGKSTATKDRTSRQKYIWRLLFLSTGERSLAEHAAIAGNPSHAGAELRTVDVNAGTRKFRAFDNVHGMTGEEFHRRLSVEVTQNFGHAGPEIVKAILATNKQDDLQTRYNEVRGYFESPGAQSGRVADRFAAAAMAGEYAIEKGILPWKKGHAVSACRALFFEWMSNMGSGNVEDRQIIQGISDFIEAHGDSRFTPLKPPVKFYNEEPPKVINRAGYTDRNEESGNLLYLFNKQALCSAVPQGYGEERICKALDAVGAIETSWEGGQRRFAKKFTVPTGGRPRLYVIDPERLQTS